MFKWGGGGTGIGMVFEHFFLSPLGILTTNFASNCGFVKHRKGYFIRFEQFSSPKGGEFDQQNATKS